MRFRYRTFDWYRNDCWSSKGPVLYSTRERHLINGAHCWVIRFSTHPNEILNLESYHNAKVVISIGNCVSDVFRILTSLVLL